MDMLQAERLLKQSEEVEKLGKTEKAWNTERMREIKTRLGGLMVVQGKNQRAHEYLKKAVELTFTAHGPHHFETTMARCRLASCVADLGE